MSQLFNKVFFSRLDDLTGEEKQQLLEVEGAANVVRRETLNLFGVGFTEEEKRMAVYDHVASDAASYEEVEDEL